MINAINDAGATSKETRRTSDRELTAGELDQVCGGEKRNAAPKTPSVSETLHLNYGEVVFEYTKQ